MNGITSCTLAATVALSGACWGCAPPSRPPGGRLVRLTTGPKGATFFTVGQAIASVYNLSLPDVSAEVLASGGSSTNIEAIENGAADLGLATSDTVYTAFGRGTPEAAKPHTHLRGVAVLFPNVLHIFVRQDSTMRTLNDLRGRRVGLISPTPFTGPLPNGRTAAILHAIGGQGHEPQPVALTQVEDVVASLEHGDIDAGFLYGGYPFQPVMLSAESYGVQLIGIDRATLSVMRVGHPFFKQAVIPAGTYPGQNRDVATLAIDNLMICRDGLPADLVYRLTRAFYEDLRGPQTHHPALQQIDAEEGPSTPIPLHEGAERYYRERELWR